MFYAQFLIKKGPLANIWFVAHWERKLSRQLVFETDVNSVVGEIMRPKVKLSLRMNAKLLWGIVKIYAKKADFVLHDLERARKIFHHFAEKEKEHQRAYRRRAATKPNVTTILEGEEEEMELEMTVPDMRDFAFPPGPEFNGRAQNGDITLREHDDNALIYNDLSFMDQIFDRETGDADVEEFLDREIGRLSRAESAVSNGDIQNQMIAEIEHDQSVTEEARRRVSTDDNNLQPVFAQPELSKDRTDIENFTRLRGSGQFHMSIDMAEPMDTESFVVPPEVVAGEQDESPSASKITLDLLSESQIRRALAEERPARRRKRPRELLVDNDISLEDSEISRQMRNIKDIIVDGIDLAPKFKQVMNAKLLGSLSYIFNNPATNIAVNPNFKKMYSDNCVPRSKPPSNVPTAEQIRRSMELADEPQVHPDEMDARRSRASSRQSLSYLIPPDPADTSLMDNAMNASLLEGNTGTGIQASMHHHRDTAFNNAAVDDSLLEMHTQDPEPVNFFDDIALSNNSLPNDILDEEFDEDRENVNPFAGPAPKRSRTEEEIRIEEQKAQKSAASLLRLIKTESKKTGQQRMNFVELVLPNVSNMEQIKQMPKETHQHMTKKAAHQFYALLELRKTRAIDVEQSGSYKPIFVTLK